MARTSGRLRARGQVPEMDLFLEVIRKFLEGGFALVAILLEALARRLVEFLEGSTLRRRLEELLAVVFDPWRLAELLEEMGALRLLVGILEVDCALRRPVDPLGSRFVVT